MIYNPNLNRVATQTAQSSALLLCLPFDMAREQYAGAVRAGMIEASMLAGAQFARTLSAIEAAALGPWARRV